MSRKDIRKEGLLDTIVYKIIMGERGSDQNLKKKL